MALSFVPELFANSVEGPGSNHAPWYAALLIAIVIGALCQRSRLCMAGGIRDVVMFKDLHLVYGFLAIIATVMLGNLILGKLNFGFEGQPIAHNDWLYNFLGMTLVGWGSVLLGGCPLRQLVLAGEGNSDSAITVFGFMAGAAVSHNFGLASGGTGIGQGPVLWVLIAGFVFLAVISVFNIKRRA